MASSSLSGILLMWLLFEKCGGRRSRFLECVFISGPLLLMGIVWTSWKSILLFDMPEALDWKKRSVARKPCYLPTSQYRSLRPIPPGRRDILLLNNRFNWTKTTRGSLSIGGTRSWASLISMGKLSRKDACILFCAEFFAWKENNIYRN